LHYRTLMRLHLDALWWLDSLRELQHLTNTEVMNSLLQDAVQFLKSTIAEELPASLKAESEQVAVQQAIDIMPSRNSTPLTLLP
jgi:hypothetical protein